jgi:hypothetical protein
MTTQLTSTHKSRFHKGGNWLTNIHAMIHAINNDPTNPARFPRTLVLIAENYSENKNNTIFAGLQHLILLGWFDECSFFSALWGTLITALTNVTQFTQNCWTIPYQPLLAQFDFTAVYGPTKVSVQNRPL